MIQIQISSQGLKSLPHMGEREREYHFYDYVLAFYFIVRVSITF